MARFADEFFKQTMVLLAETIEAEASDVSIKRSERSMIAASYFTKENAKFEVVLHLTWINEGTEIKPKTTIYMSNAIYLDYGCLSIDGDYREYTIDLCNDRFCKCVDYSQNVALRSAEY